MVSAAFGCCGRDKVRESEIDTRSHCNLANEVEPRLKIVSINLIDASFVELPPSDPSEEGCFVWGRQHVRPEVGTTRGWDLRENFRHAAPDANGCSKSAHLT